MAPASVASLQGAGLTEASFQPFKRQVRQTITDRHIYEEQVVDLLSELQIRHAFRLLPYLTLRMSDRELKDFASELQLRTTELKSYYAVIPEFHTVDLNKCSILTAQIQLAQQQYQEYLQCVSSSDVTIFYYTEEPKHPSHILQVMPSRLMQTLWKDRYIEFPWVPRVELEPYCQKIVHGKHTIGFGVILTNIDLVQLQFEVKDARQCGHIFKLMTNVSTVVPTVFQEMALSRRALMIPSRQCPNEKAKMDIERFLSEQPTLRFHEKMLASAPTFGAGPAIQTGQDNLHPASERPRYRTKSIASRDVKRNNPYPGNNKADGELLEPELTEDQSAKAYISFRNAQVNQRPEYARREQPGPSNYPGNGLLEIGEQQGYSVQDVRQADRSTRPGPPLGVSLETLVSSVSDDEDISPRNTSRQPLRPVDTSPQPTQSVTIPAAYERKPHQVSPPIIPQVSPLSFFCSPKSVPVVRRLADLQMQARADSFLSNDDTPEPDDDHYGSSVIDQALLLEDKERSQKSSDEDKTASHSPSNPSSPTAETYVTPHSNYDSWVTEIDEGSSRPVLSAHEKTPLRARRAKARFRPISHSNLASQCESSASASQALEFEKLPASSLPRQGSYMSHRRPRSALSESLMPGADGLLRSIVESPESPLGLNAYFKPRTPSPSRNTSDPEESASEQLESSTELQVSSGSTEEEQQDNAATDLTRRRMSADKGKARATSPSTNEEGSVDKQDPFNVYTRAMYPTSPSQFVQSSDISFSQCQQINFLIPQPGTIADQGLTAYEARKMGIERWHQQNIKKVEALKSIEKFREPKMRKGSEDRLPHEMIRGQSGINNIEEGPPSSRESTRGRAEAPGNNSITDSRQVGVRQPLTKPTKDTSFEQGLQYVNETLRHLKYVKAKVDMNTPGIEDMLPGGPIQQGWSGAW